MSTYLLVHGSFQGGWIWRRTAASLADKGHRVMMPTLPGCGERAESLREGLTVTSAAEELQRLLFLEDVSDVVVVGTSSGGLVVEKLGVLAKEHFARLVFLDALVPQPGQYVSEIVERPADAPPYKFTELARGPTKEQMATGLFAELDEVTKAWALDRATMHPLGLSDQRPGELDEFWDNTWDATVIRCTRSANPPLAHQRATAERLDARWLEMDAGHYPMLTHPELTARLLEG